MAWLRTLLQYLGLAAEVAAAVSPNKDVQKAAEAARVANEAAERIGKRG